MLKLHQDGIKTLYRSKSQIVEHKKLKQGKSASSWFLKGNTKQVLMVPATPGSALKNGINRSIGSIIGPDQGLTKVIERGGQPLLAGIKKDDPCRGEGCDFGDANSLVGPGCMKTGVCYMIECIKCNPDPVASRRPRQSTQTQKVAGSRRSQYIGQTGTSLHRRMISHRGV